MGSIKLEKPMYYKNEFALRFELGPPDVGLWIDSEREVINEEYFRVATERSFSIYKSAFMPSDEIKVCYQIFSDGRQKIRKGDYFFTLVKDFMCKKIEFSDHKELYSEDLERKRHCWKRVTISNVLASELDVEDILEALINSDFSSRGPSLRGEFYIINCTKGLVFHIYDDRGMDIVSDRKEALESIYRKHYEWLLGYDKDYMDSLFS